MTATTTTAPRTASAPTPDPSPASGPESNPPRTTDPSPSPIPTPAFEIELSAPVNLRDLGGIPIAGGLLREGLAIRTDDLAYVTHDVASALVAEGLTAIIDLRSPLEAAVTGRGPLGRFPVAYHHLPLLADVAEPLREDGPAPRRAPDLGHAAMGAMYVRMMENAAPQLVTALNVIACTPGATAFHCAAGRDRTGVLAAALLLTLGADEEHIVADYARTGANMGAIIRRTRPVLGAMWRALGFDPDAHDASALLEGSMEVSMRILLDTLRERHGDALAPLRRSGLSEDTIVRLRRRALQG
ncbi:tyrosine-protein phosphatase [Leucobacter triazinivorans]|uniref:Protein-tyrosine-phosphatase n=1 Tax=Leucobacter triazinivorans TaxID=1784719 RepID=A0A4P6KFN9_9MICO|nr:tyrosine-protein phosphatase [Leucobacter triazinivorans]QBE49247.1 protein-tyrosine-phosphatase [Leucobacter triazinivorans]